MAYLCSYVYDILICPQIPTEWMNEYWMISQHKTIYRPLALGVKKAYYVEFICAYTDP